MRKYKKRTYMKNLYTKLLAVQKKVKAISKDSVNPHFKSRYFDINGLLSELKPVLNDVGLVVLQPLMQENGASIITTIIADPESGEEQRYQMLLPETQSTQQMGAAISYMRRYALSSLFLLEGEDDDANSVVPVAKKETPHFLSAKKMLAESDDAKREAVRGMIATSTKLTQAEKDALLK